MAVENDDKGDELKKLFKSNADRLDSVKSQYVEVEASSFVEMMNMIIIALQSMYLFAAFLADVFRNQSFYFMASVITLLGFIPSLVLFFVELYWKGKGYTDKAFKIGWRVSCLAIIFGILFFVEVAMLIIGLASIGSMLP